MIYLITGVPGSGKTLYAVSTLVRDLAAQKIVKRGVTITRRVCVDGIKDLLLPHEMIAPGVEDDEGNLSPGEGDGVWNWPTWCKPGDVIVIDEVQRWWRPRGMGTKPPLAIKALETHRHMGVDFVLVTQNPMLLDQNVRRLTGRHQHLRRLWGFARAIIYDWDGCSVDVHRTKSATMSMWGYPKSAYDLYKSSELHTKQKQKIPPWLIVPVLALVGGIAVAPMAFGTMKGAMTGKGVSQTATAAPVSSVAPPAASSVVAASAPVASASQSSGSEISSLGSQTEKVELAGCISAPAKGCKCFDVKGRKVEADPDMCLTGEKPIAASDLPAPEFSKAADPADLEVLAFMHSKAARLPP